MGGAGGVYERRRERGLEEDGGKEETSRGGRSSRSDLPNAIWSEFGCYLPINSINCNTLNIHTAGYESYSLFIS